MPVSAPQTSAPKTSLTPHEQDVWKGIIAPAELFLSQVKNQLEAQVDQFEPEIAHYARYALSNQGKQIRPVLTALAGNAVGALNDSHVTIAVIIEMIHLATLVHDDIMDQAALRRGQPTLAATWGNDVAVLLGDCLFAHALKLAAQFPTPDVCRAVASATGVVCTGEIMQSHRRRRWKTTRDDYVRVVQMKTGELFSLACELGAQSSGCPQPLQLALRHYGLALGTAYQMYDDCLDLYGHEADAGKSLGTDLASGKLTLPVLLFLEHASPASQNRLIQFLENWQPALLPQVRRLLDDHHALPASIQFVDQFLSSAINALAPLPHSPSRESLQHFPQFLSQRIHALSV